MQIYDLNGTPRDWSWLREKYGRLEHLAVDPAPAFRLVEIREGGGGAQAAGVEAAALMKVRVLDAHGAPMQALVIMTYPSLTAPSSALPDLMGADLAASQWSARGAAQFTDAASGVTGFGLGADSWIKDKAAGGPYHVWVFHPQYHSDCLSWIGWLGGTDHVGPTDLTFQLVLAGQPEPEPEPEPEPPDGELKELVVRLGRHLGAW